MTSAMGEAALELAEGGWAVIPLRGKAPRTSHGVLDASTELAVVEGWWERWPQANVGARVPERLMVLDVDPRRGGLEALIRWETAHGPIETLTVWSGREDGGRHLYLRRPLREISSARLKGWGWDLKTSSGYAVMPPSIHPDTGRPYRWGDTAAKAVWPDTALMALLSPLEAPRAAPRKPWSGDGASPADWYTDTHTWADVLGPHGWRVVRGDGEEDGSAWCHPAATSACSASIRHGQLFNYSTSSGLPVTEPGAPQGLTRFRAWAWLEHGGDLSAARSAARLLMEQRP
jgi:hypothetical protein